MSNRNKIWILTPLLLLLSIAGCSSGGGETAPPPASPAPVTADAAASFSYSGSGFGIDHVSTPSSDTTDTALSYDINLGSAIKDVYFIFTNISDADTSAPPSITSNMASPVEQYTAATILSNNLAAQAKEQGVGLMDRQDIALFNSNPELYSEHNLLASPYSALIAPPPAPQFDTLEQPVTFFQTTDTSIPIDAKCKKIVPVSNGRTINIYVADDSWGAGCAKANCVTQEMVDALAGKLDAYGLLTNIFGAEWGSHVDPAFIPFNNNISILLFDVDNDNSTNGGVVGYFWSKDNYLASLLPGSNERIMIYLDSVMFATPDGVWQIGDYWPDTITSAFAHELQHMINFYQKHVLRGTSCETWLNEMCSLVAEDLLAKDLQINGPRGVTYSDGSAGTTNNFLGRLPRFNRYNYTPITQWLTGSSLSTGEDNVLNSYSANYSFGAFLARNFDGANLFKKIVQNDKGDRTAIDFALNSLGTGETFDTALQKWGVACLLSDQISAPTGYRFNTDSFILATADSTTYSLGSINLNNYIFTEAVPYQLGPKIYTSLPPTDANAGTYKTSNMFYRLGSNLSGTINTIINLKKGTKITTLVK